MKILFATDNSDASKAAARFLGRMPFTEQIDVVALHVVTAGNASARVGMHPGWARVVESMVKDATKDTDEVAAMIGEVAGKVETVVHRGHPAEVTIAEADKRMAEMIVMGAVGHSAVRRIMLGSISDQVATHSHVPTLVYRPGHDGGASKFRVLIGYDGSEKSKAAVNAVASAFQNEELDVTLVAVIPELGRLAIEYAEAAQEAWDADRKSMSEALEAEVGVLANSGISATAVLASSEHVGDELCRQAIKHNADLVVVGDQGHGAVQRFILGSVSRYVLRHCERSVLVDRR